MKSSSIHDFLWTKWLNQSKEKPIRDEWVAMPRIQRLGLALPIFGMPPGRF